MEEGTTSIIHIDQEHLEQVLKNIILNAEEAIPEGQKGIISLRLKSMEQQAIIEIADNGTGIAASVIKNIFEASPSLFVEHILDEGSVFLSALMNDYQKNIVL